MKREPWTDEQDVTLRRLWAADVAVAGIAAAVGKTRNSVVGRAFRLELPRKVRETKVATIGPTPAKRINRGRDSARAAAILRRGPEPLPPRPFNIAPDPLTATKRFLDTVYGDCRWIMDDEPIAERMVCGRPVKQGRSFCPHHHARAYTTSPEVRAPKSDHPGKPSMSSRILDIEGAAA